MKNHKDILNRYFDQVRQQPSLIASEEAAEIISRRRTAERTGRKRIQGIAGTALVGSVVLALFFLTPRDETPRETVQAENIAMTRGERAPQPGERISSLNGIQSTGIPLHEAGSAAERQSTAVRPTESEGPLNSGRESEPTGSTNKEADQVHIPSTIPPVIKTPDEQSSSSLQDMPLSELQDMLIPAAESVPEPVSPGYIRATSELNPLPETGKGQVQEKIVVMKLASINSYFDDYNPMVTADGRTLYFVSNREHGLGGHDFWVAEKEERDGLEFSTPSNLGSSINSSRNEGGATISADGQTMYFTACSRPDGLGDCDIYEARLEEVGWVEVRNVREVNTGDWEAQPTVSSDGRSLFFVSNRPGAIGGNEDTDIYVSYKQADGTWSRPKNLGRPINTKKKEDSPFIVPAGNALYFSSQGHKGYGGFDFFVSRLTDEAAWEQPVNLGPEFNTSNDERFITVPAAEDVIYFTKGESEKLDLYMARKQTRSTSIVIKGNVVDRETQALYHADLLFVDARSGEIISYAGTNAGTEEFSLVLGKNTSRRLIDVYGFNDSLGEFRTRIVLEPTDTYLEYRCKIFLNSSATSASKELSDYAPRLAVSPSDIRGEFTVESSEQQEGELTVLDVWGNVLLQHNLSAGTRERINLANAPEGIYLARLGESTALLPLHQGKISPKKRED